MKRFVSMLCAAFLVCSLTIPAFAAEDDRAVIDLGGGFYMVEQISYQIGPRDENLVYSRKVGTAYYNNTQVGTATLAASFDISGSTAEATSASISGNGLNGGAYENGSTRCSGNKAIGTATFSYGGVSRSLTLTLTCTPGGSVT